MGEAAGRAVIKGGHAKDTYLRNSHISEDVLGYGEDQLAISVNFVT